MLEFQHDDKVLGYLCGSSSRTITPQLPDHPSQIKGIRSANDQMFTYSSWSSRSWLIIRGAQPAVQQQHGLNALKRLYEAKGFDSHLLRDVRRRLGTKSACCLVALLLVGCACDCLSECRVVCMQLAQNHGGVHGHQSITPRRLGSNHEPSDAGSRSKLHQWQ